MATDRFLLIKAWSYILWQDVDHVLGQLLIAEMADRIPVVYWPTHCLNNGFVQTNGFELYFEPLSSYTIFHISKPEYTYYPPIWDSDNLLADDHSKDTWAYRNVGDILGSKANVVVGDVYYNVNELIPFIRKNHPAYGMNSAQVYKYLFSKYIKVKPDIDMEIQGFYNSWLKDNHPVLAVHVRRYKPGTIYDTRESDRFDNKYRNKAYKQIITPASIKESSVIKALKKGKLREPNKIYHKEIRKIIDKYNIKKIFLLTDCKATVKEYKELYGSKVVFTDCVRVAGGEEDINLIENTMIKRRRGIEVIKDAFIAAKCDFFIGNDFSNLSHAVTRMKDWPSKNVKLLYWVYKRRKYPVNSQLIYREDNSWYKRLFRKLLGWLLPQEGGAAHDK